MAEAAKKETAKVYYVVNTVRRVGSRLHRVMAHRRHRFQLWVAGRRLLRNKRLALTEEIFRLEESRIKEMLLAGQVALITPDNIKVTTTPHGEYILTKVATGATKKLAKGEVPSCFGGAPAAHKAQEPPPVPKPAPAPPAQKDVLTELPHVGAGRARKLEAAGVTSYAQVSEKGVAGMVSLLGVTEEMAAEIVAAAKDKG